MATKKTKVPSKAPKKQKAPKAKPVCIVDVPMQVACGSVTRPTSWKFQRKTADGYEAGYISTQTPTTIADTVAALRAIARHLEKCGDFLPSFSASSKRNYIPVAYDTEGVLFFLSDQGRWPMSFPVSAISWRSGNYVPKDPHAA